MGGLSPPSLRSVLSLLLLVCLTTISGCDRPPNRPPELRFVEFGPESQKPFDSMIAVLADPQLFHGTRVRLQGVLNIELEGDQLCLDRGSLESLATMNCLRLALADSLRPKEREIARWNGYYAVVEGTLHVDDGPIFLYRARLVDVTSIVVIESGRQL